MVTADNGRYLRCVMLDNGRKWRFGAEVTVPRAAVEELGYLQSAGIREMAETLKNYETALQLLYSNFWDANQKRLQKHKRPWDTDPWVWRIAFQPLGNLQPPPQEKDGKNHEEKR